MHAHIVGPRNDARGAGGSGQGRVSFPQDSLPLGHGFALGQEGNVRCRHQQAGEGYFPRILRQGQGQFHVSDFPRQDGGQGSHARIQGHAVQGHGPAQVQVVQGSEQAAVLNGNAGVIGGKESGLEEVLGFQELGRNPRSASTRPLPINW